MEGVQKAFRKISKDVNFGASSSVDAPPPPSATLNSAPSGVLFTRPPRQMVSVWTCSKLCAIFFTAGVVVGYTLKRRVRQWAAKLLRRLKDD
ncbi:hypothetical protein Nepgr_019958 [Nepenthes gracilis]|uniref:Transmembrane protein n=1 Tax=Nepenthes gracilis TaxID=150966 RepID=A0AAD3XUK7_NEPGR|nr:hypothetical protein Nepgr_019958 [Nepenthes gracilis]